MRIVTIIVVLAALAGGAWYLGWLKVGGDGSVTATPPTITTPELDDYDRGLAAYTSSSYEECITNYRKALAKDPKNSKAEVAYYRIACSLDEQGKGKEAAAAYKVFMAKYPKSEWFEKSNKRAEILGH